MKITGTYRINDQKKLKLISNEIKYNTRYIKKVY